MKKDKEIMVTVVNKSGKDINKEFIKIVTKLYEEGRIKI